MKRKIFSLMIGAIVALSSCSKSDEMPTQPQTGDQLATFKVEAPALTRATPVEGLTRYIVEAYEGKDLDSTPLRAESANGSLTLTLKKNTEYTFVFWADYGTADANTGYWDATRLQEVKVVAGKENTAGEVAYCLVKEFNSKDFETNKTVVLKNAAAQVNFIEGAGLMADGNTLKVTYTKSATLNVATGKVADAGEVTHTFTNIAQIPKDGKLAEDYVLAPTGEQNVVNIKVQLNSQPEKTIDNVPSQQNYKTNIKGEYSNMYASTFTISNDVEDYENNPDVDFGNVAKVGDFYYSDETYSTAYDNTKTCIGIVFYVNADGTSGKIVGLDEPTANWSGGTNSKGRLTWGPATTHPKDELDGLNNMNTVKTAGSGTFNDYPAFAWVDSKNLANTDYSTPTTGVWYLPAKEELKALYGAYNGDTNVDNEVKIAVNTSLSAIGATQISDTYYWSSTDYDSYNALCVLFRDGTMGGGSKYGSSMVRAVLTF